eukprot:3813319-Alexandrium_andersonii.AAC.1
MLSLPDGPWGVDRPVLEGLGSLVDARCPRADEEGRPREIFAEPPLRGEDANPPSLDLSLET